MGAVRELTPVVDTVQRTGLKASIKAKAEAHKAHKAGLKASIKAKAAAHKAQKKGQLPEDAARLAEDAGSNPSTFEELDEDGDFLINSFEFINFRSNSGHSTFQEIDGNGDGSIDHDEFINNG